MEDTTTTMTTPSQIEAAATQANGTSSDGVSVDALVDGQLEVNLLDLGVSVEDIAAMRRIDTRIRGIEANPEKIEAIRWMKPPTTRKGGCKS